jgi:protein-disulfide isomerase
LTVPRRALAIALSLAGLAALVLVAHHDLIGDAVAQDGMAHDAKPPDRPAQNALAALVAKPVALPDMALGPAKAPVTITEYASMSCPHCAAFDENVFPMLRSKYIDTGKMRFVFREFPLDVRAAAASMLARCIANDDAEKFFGAIDTLFKQQEQLIAQPKDTLIRIGKQAGLDDQAIEACESDQAQLDKLSADQKFAFDVLKVDATPTFFINGEQIKGNMSFEDIDRKIGSLLKK